jgi:hypothetical protein
VHEAASIARNITINGSCLAACPIGKTILSNFGGVAAERIFSPRIGRPLSPLCADSDLTDEEKLALAAELKPIDEDRYPLSLRTRTLRATLDELEPPPAVTAQPLPTAKPGDRPRAALAA